MATEDVGTAVVSANYILQILELMSKRTEKREAPLADPK